MTVNCSSRPSEAKLRLDTEIVMVLGIDPAGGSVGVDPESPPPHDVRATLRATAKERQVRALGDGEPWKGLSISASLRESRFREKRS